MENINQLTGHLARSIESKQLTQDEPRREKKRYRVDGKLLTLEEMFWERMTGLYTHLWTRKYGDNPTREWELCLDGLTAEMVADGFKRIVKDKRFETFPPNPIEFRGSCFPSYDELGIPSVEQAYREATQNAGRHPDWRRWSNPACYQAACEAGFSTLKTCDDREAKSIFVSAYESVVKRIMDGESLQIPERLEKQPEKPCSKEESRKRMAELRESLGL